MNITSAISLQNNMLQKEAQLNLARQNKITQSQGDERQKLEEARLRQVGDDFESLFTKMLIDTMHDTLNKEEDMFYGGQAQEIFDDMRNQEYAKIMAKTGALGISDMIVESYRDAL